MVFIQTNFIEAGWKAECLAVRSSFWWPEAAKSPNKHGHSRKGEDSARGKGMKEEGRMARKEEVEAKKRERIREKR
jgi:hypothetical protein